MKRSVYGVAGVAYGPGLKNIPGNVQTSLLCHTLLLVNQNLHSAGFMGIDSERGCQEAIRALHSTIALLNYLGVHTQRKKALNKGYVHSIVWLLYFLKALEGLQQLQELYPKCPAIQPEQARASSPVTG